MALQCCSSTESLEAVFTLMCFFTIVSFHVLLQVWLASKDFWTCVTSIWLYTMYIWYVFPTAVCCFELFITVITGEALFSMYLLMSCQTSLGGECLSTSVAYRSSHWSLMVERWNITGCTSSYPDDIIKCDKVCLCVCLVWVSVTSLTMVTNTWAASIVLLYCRQKVDNPKISSNSNQDCRDLPATCGLDVIITVGC